MKEWEYIRLMNRNYLQVRVKQEAIEDLFQYRMMVSGPIKGLLECRMRELNGMDFLLYDISSMQSISSLYAEKKMDFSAFYQLIYCIENTTKNVKEFLLEKEHFMLYPEFVFQEIETKEYNFVYYPGELGACNDSGKKLYEFLLSVADHEDTVLTNIIYQSYECVGDEDGFSWIEYLDRKLQQEYDIRNKECDVSQKDDFCRDEPKQLETLEDDFEGRPFWDNEICIEGENQSKKEIKLVKKAKKALVFILLYALAVGFGIYYLYSNYILDLRENVVTWVALVVITALLALWMFMWIKKRDYSTNGNVIKTANVYEECTNSFADYSQILEESYSEPDAYGKTIFFEAEEIENKLYGIGKKNKRTIQINKFPFVIGKKEDSVDGVLEDASISRVHARFFQSESILWVEDLNSTNGTYKNGIMLAPHEKVEVLPEDEIRFGKLQFIYR